MTIVDAWRLIADVLGLSLAGAVALAAIPGTFVRKALDSWIEGRVSHRFDLALENHRHELNLASERVKTRYQSELQNLAIVAERRHEVCRELYRLLHEAQGRVAGLYGAREAPDFEQYSRDEVTAYMDDRRISANAKAAVIELWDEDIHAAVERLRAADRIVEVALASQSHSDAWNYFLTNSLYLPDDVTTLARQVFDTLWQILGAAKLPRGTYRGTEITQLKQESSDCIWQLRGRLQTFLGVTVDQQDTRPETAE